MQREDCVILEKVSPNDDEMSTVSGSSLEQLSIPSSPPTIEPEVLEQSGTLPAVTLADLPSLGSLGHFVGQCSKCCFFPKGRCTNGYECRFCHFEHEKRQRKKRPHDHSRPAHPAPQVNPYHQQFEQVYLQGTSIAPGLAPRVIAPPAPIAPSPAAVPICSAQVGSAFPTQGQSQDVAGWSVERVLEWLTLSGLGHLSQSFLEHRITGDILLDISSKDLEEIGVHAVGDKKRFLRVACELRGQPAPALPNAPPPPPLPYPSQHTYLCDMRPRPPPLNQYQSPFSSPMPDPAANFPGW